MWQWNGFKGQELFKAGIISRPSKNLNIFSEFKVDPTKKAEVITGFKTRFPEWNITGTISSTGKATSLYKRNMEIFEVAF